MKKSVPQRIGREIARPFKKMYKKVGIKLGFIAPPPKTAMDREEIEADRAKYIAMNVDKDFLISKEFDYICPGDKYANNGAVDSGYFIQDIWGARKVAEFREYLKGQNILHNFIHYDVGSSVGGFIAHLQALHQEVCLIDIRPMQSLKSRFLETGGGGVKYIQADATNLDGIDDCSIYSISALCSVEHFGLGRYGDPIDPQGWEKALKAFQRVLKPGGRLYFSVPVGQVNKVCFNAHRVYKPQKIIDALDKMDILEMSYIDGFETIMCLERVHGNLITHKENLDSIPDHINGGNVGLFEFVKK